MSSRQEKLEERAARQARIDAACVDPAWKKQIDEPLIAMCEPVFSEKSPVVLLPELRAKSLLQGIAASMPESGKIMIVDDQNTRFELLKSSAKTAKAHLYFSAQEVSALNYASDIFHLAATEIGLATLFRFEYIVPSYRRVLRNNGKFVCSVPVAGTFPEFMDIFEESLHCLHPDIFEEIRSELASCMDPDYAPKALEESGFEVVRKVDLSVGLSFDDVEKLLFSTVAESHFLGLCMGMRRLEIDARELLTHVVRSFHHYFQGVSPSVTMRCAGLECIKRQ